MGFMDKMKDLVGIVDDYDDDEYEVSQEEVDAYKKEMSAAAEPAAPLPPAGGFSPRSYGNVEPPQRFGSAAPAQNAEPLADSRASIKIYCKRFCQALF